MIFPKKRNGKDSIRQKHAFAISALMMRLYAPPAIRLLFIAFNKLVMTRTFSPVKNRLYLTNRQYSFMPQYPSDMIYSVFSVEWFSLVP